MIPKFGGKKLKGEIEFREDEKIYVDIYNADKSIATTNYYIVFEKDRAVYQLQHDALDIIEKHKLFNILINNPIYYGQKENCSPCVSPSEFDNELNIEQIQAINSIIKGEYHPVPYLLYGPPGKTIIYLHFFYI